MSHADVPCTADWKDAAGWLYTPRGKHIKAFGSCRVIGENCVVSGIWLSLRAYSHWVIRTAPGTVFRCGARQRCLIAPLITENDEVRKPWKENYDLNYIQIIVNLRIDPLMFRPRLLFESDTCIVKQTVYETIQPRAATALAFITLSSISADSSVS